jgi:hypothetical protein
MSTYTNFTATVVLDENGKQHLQGVHEFQQFYNAIYFGGDWPEELGPEPLDHEDRVLAAVHFGLRHDLTLADMAELASFVEQEYGNGGWPLKITASGAEISYSDDGGMDQIAAALHLTLARFGRSGEAVAYIWRDEAVDYVKAKGAIIVACNYTEAASTHTNGENFNPEWWLGERGYFRGDRMFILHSEQPTEIGRGAFEGSPVRGKKRRAKPGAA